MLLEVRLDRLLPHMHNIIEVSEQRRGCEQWDGAIGALEKTLKIERFIIE